jgi:hypothetical protein
MARRMTGVKGKKKKVAAPIDAVLGHTHVGRLLARALEPSLAERLGFSAVLASPLPVPDAPGAAEELLKIVSATDADVKAASRDFHQQVKAGTKDEADQHADGRYVYCGLLWKGAPGMVRFCMCACLHLRVCGCGRSRFCICVGGACVRTASVRVFMHEY